MRLEFHPEAELELIEAAVYYEGSSGFSVGLPAAMQAG